jgi:hypothetical protein
MITIIVSVLIAALASGLVTVGASVLVVQQYERGVVFRFGRVRPATRGPGLALITPFADRLQKSCMQIITEPVPAQDGITRDNVTVRVDAVLYFRVIDAVRVAVDVQDYASAILQVAQASLRSIIGKSELDALLSNREQLNQGLGLMIDGPALGWGVHIDRVEIKDVALPTACLAHLAPSPDDERARHEHRRRCLRTHASGPYPTERPLLGCDQQGPGRGSARDLPQAACLPEYDHGPSRVTLFDCMVGPGCTTAAPTTTCAPRNRDPHRRRRVSASPHPSPDRAELVVMATSPDFA